MTFCKDPVSSLPVLLGAYWTGLYRLFVVIGLLWSLDTSLYVKLRFKLLISQSNHVSNCINDFLSSNETESPVIMIIIYDLMTELFFGVCSQIQRTSDRKHQNSGTPTADPGGVCQRSPVGAVPGHKAYQKDCKCFYIFILFVIKTPYFRFQVLFYKKVLPEVCFKRF